MTFEELKVNCDGMPPGCGVPPGYDGVPPGCVSCDGVPPGCVCCVVLSPFNSSIATPLISDACLTLEAFDCAMYSSAVFGFSQWYIR